jgi:hypothetical protein
MADDRSLSDLLWDYTVYAPIGLALSVAEQLPKLSEKGRERLAGRIQVARVVGRFTAAEAQKRVGRILDEGSGPSATTGQPAASAPSPAPPASSESSDLAHGSDNGSRARRSSAASRSRRGSSTVPGQNLATPKAAPDLVTPASQPPAQDLATPASQPPAQDLAAPAPAVASLAIPGYDTLAASQVVQRLSSLRNDELDAVRLYEIATRGRRTILHRIAQLAADR